MVAVQADEVLREGCLHARLVLGLLGGEGVAALRWLGRLRRHLHFHVLRARAAHFSCCTCSRSRSRVRRALTPARQGFAVVVAEGSDEWPSGCWLRYRGLGRSAAHRELSAPRRACLHRASAAQASSVTCSEVPATCTTVVHSGFFSARVVQTRNKLKRR